MNLPPGWTAVPAGPDIDPTDRAAFEAHGRTGRHTPDGYVMAAWYVHPDTAAAFRRPRTAPPWATCALPAAAPADLIGTPLFLDDTVPVGLLRPVHHVAPLPPEDTP